MDCALQLVHPSVNPHPYICTLYTTQYSQEGIATSALSIIWLHCLELFHHAASVVGIKPHGLILAGWQRTGQVQ